MTFTNASICLLLAMVMGSIVGISIRCRQEGYHFRIWFLAWISVLTYFLLTIAVPVFVIRFLRKNEGFKKLSGVKKTYVFVLILPRSIIYHIAGFLDSYEKLFDLLDQVDDALTLKKKLKAKNKKKITLRGSITNLFSTNLPRQSYEKIIERFAH